MNMILHDVHYSRFDIQQEDTLEHPQHIEERFDAVVANPPFSAKWSASGLFMNDERFSQYGKLAPSSKADFAFLQHMIHQLSDGGTMAIVLPHGVLFRGGAEGHIREYLIKKLNYLDAVIGLPANIFYGTSIPTCILVLKKYREHSDNILFIDASEHCEKATNQSYLRKQDIEKIIKSYRERTSEERYSLVVELKDVHESEYNLNIPRYVDTFEEEVEVDLNEITIELANIENEITKVDSTISDYCKELGIKSP